jgi:uncharacterized protein (TIGR02246 family)
MKTAFAMSCALLVFGFATQSWAGPAEEVARIAAARFQAFEDGSVDGYTANFADNAVLTSSISAFRIEGKEAIRAYFVETFQLYPKRRLFGRQPVTRVYNDDLVVQDSYNVLNLTDPAGKVTVLPLRASVTWSKLGGQWQIVDQHVSRVPMAP